MQDIIIKEIPKYSLVRSSFIGCKVFVRDDEKGKYMKCEDVERIIKILCDGLREEQLG